MISLNVTQSAAQLVTFSDKAGVDVTQEVLASNPLSVVATVDNAAIVTPSLVPGTNSDGSKNLTLNVLAVAVGTANVSVTDTNPDNTTAVGVLAFTVGTAFDDATSVNFSAPIITGPASAKAKK